MFCIFILNNVQGFKQQISDGHISFRLVLSQVSSLKKKKILWYYASSHSLHIIPLWGAKVIMYTSDFLSLEETARWRVLEKVLCICASSVLLPLLQQWIIVSLVQPSSKIAKWSVTHMFTLICIKYVFTILREVLKDCCGRWRRKWTDPKWHSHVSLKFMTTFSKQHFV